MSNFLLFDRDCQICTGIAHDIEAEANGWLTVRALDDPDMRELIEAHRPEAGWQPMLIQQTAQGVKINTGVKMTLRLIQGVGPTSSYRIGRMVHAAIQGTLHEARRRLFRTAGASALALGAMAAGLTPAAGAGAESSARVLRGPELDALVARAKRNSSFVSSTSWAKTNGFAVDNPEIVGLDLGDEGLLLFSFLASRGNPTSEAAVLSFAVGLDGKETVELESVQVDEQIRESADFSLADISVASLNATGGMQTMSKKAYFGCMGTCLAVRCGGNVAKCSRIPFLAAALACMVGVCGSKAKTCHKVCKKKW